jgi:hypothetical protein
MSKMLVSVAVLVALAATGCNAVLGADEPTLPNGKGSAEDLDPPSDPAVCGDGVIDFGEACDDTNDDSADGCAECQIICGGTFPEALDERTGHCYLLGGIPDGATSPAATPDPQGWQAAIAECASWNGTLASITPTITPTSTTYDELAFVQHFAMRADTAIWLSASREGGDFTWVTGEILDANDKAWAPGSPNVDAETDCVALGNTSLGFENTDCGSLRPFLCERGVPGQPAEE